MGGQKLPELYIVGRIENRVKIFEKKKWKKPQSFD